MNVVRTALAMTILAAARIGGAEPCLPRAALDGDAAAVATVGAELSRLGVTVTSGTTSSKELGTTNATCPVIVAAVELDRGGGIAVAVRDGSQRSEGRVVSDASLAAAWIDSWLRDDFDAPIFTPVSRPGVVRSAPAAVIVEVAPAQPMLERLSLAAGFEQAWTDDGSRWSGVAVAACARVGFACVGVRARYASQDVTANQTAATRRDASLVATASVAGEIGRMVVVPELGLGVGRLSTTRLDGCKPPPCDPNDPSCLAKQPPCGTDPGTTLLIGDHLAESTWTPRASAALRVVIPLFDHVWLDGSAAVTLSPFGHRDPLEPDPVTGTVAGVPPDQIALPGEPLATFQLTVGVRVGAP